MADTKRQVIGQIGEDYVCKFLMKHNFKILDRNYRRPWGELDIVAEKDNRRHFVEVKTVVRENFTPDDYQPEDNIHPWKQKRLRRIIETYLLAHDEDFDWQVDAVAVYLDSANQFKRLDWLEDIVI